MIGIDTDVLGIHHIFKQDGRYPATERFLRESERIERGVPIFSLLELCGLIATASQPDEAALIFEEYLASDDTSILYPRSPFKRQRNGYRVTDIFEDERCTSSLPDDSLMTKEQTTHDEI